MHAKRVVYWSHFPSTGRSAAAQRFCAFRQQIEGAGHEVIAIGGRFGTKLGKVQRVWQEAWEFLSARGSVYIVSVPPYRSALAQIVLAILMPWRTVILDQRDLVLAQSATVLDRWLERLIVWRSDAIIVTTRTQLRALRNRYSDLSRATVIRNGASRDLASSVSTRSSESLTPDRVIRVLYQGLVGGKKLAEVAMRIAPLGCDLDLAIFVDESSAQEIDAIRAQWTGPGRLRIHANVCAGDLAMLIDAADVALNPVPDSMDYAFTVKSADYAVRGVPQLVVGSRCSMTRRAVEFCRLGHAVGSIGEIDSLALLQAITKFRPRVAWELRPFLRDTHAPRVLDLLATVS